MNDEANDAVFDYVSLTPGAALTGGIGGATLQIAAAGVNILTGLFRSDKLQKQVFLSCISMLYFYYP